MRQGGGGSRGGEQVLAGLLQSDHRVQLGRSLVGRHRAQEVDVRRRHFHVDQEIRAVRRKPGSASSMSSDQQRIDVEAAVGRVFQRYRERRVMHAVHHAADGVRGLDRDRTTSRAPGSGGWPRAGTAAACGARKAARKCARSRRKSREARLQPEIEHDVDQRIARPCTSG